MNLVIQGRVDTPTDCFQIEVEFMHGDADGTSFEKLQYIEPKTCIKDIKFLLACKAEYEDSGMGGDDGYWHIEGWNDSWEDIFPLDNEYCDGHAKVRNIEVTWFNAFGEQYHVEVR